MLGYNDIGIDFLTGSPFPVWLALLILIALAVILYRRTNPPLPFWRRFPLWLLRTIAVIALIAALLEPVIRYSRSFERQRRISVIVDRSASMNREEEGKTRQARLDSLLSSQSFDRLARSTEMRTYYFSDKLDESKGEMDVDKTAIGEALVGLTQMELGQPADNWLLFSDGRSNSGREASDAARELSSPVSSVYLGGERGSFDVAIASVDVNPILFVGQQSEIKLKLAWHDAKDKNPLLRLFDSKSVRSERRYRISQDDGFGEMTIKYTPDEPGQKLLTITIPEMTGEESIGNNQRSVAVTVLKSKLSVLIVADHPDYEIGFLQRHLRQSDRYDVRLILTGQKGGNLSGTFPARQSELNQYDLVVLHDVKPQSLAAAQSRIESYLKDKGGAIWLLMGEQFAASQPLAWFNELLPFYPSRSATVHYREFQGTPAEGNLFHPAVRLADNRADIRKAWESLPPFKSLVLCDQLSPQGVMLAYASLADNEGTDPLPILGYRRTGPGKVIATAALPIWNWGFINRGFGEDDRFYALFLEGAISWLTIPEEFDPVRIRPDRQVFSRGEIVRFQGFAFDQGFRPIPGVSGSVTLTADDSGESFEADLIDLGEGKFLAELQSLPPARYGYHGEFEKGGVKLKTQNGRIIVEPFSLEDVDQSGDPNVLRAVSRLSGGEFYDFDDFDKILSAIDLAPIKQSKEGEIALWGRFWLLFLFLGALSLEWVLRKMNQLI